MRKLVLGMVAVVLLIVSGCAGVPTMQPRSELIQQIPTLNKNLSRMYFFYGNLYLSGNRLDLNKGNSGGIAGRIFVDGSEVGFINGEEYIVIDLQPIEHDFYWKMIAGENNSSHSESQKLTLKLSPGETYYLASNARDVSGMAKWFGLLGALTVDVDTIYTLEVEPLNPTSTRLVDYKVLNESNLSSDQFPIQHIKSTSRDLPKEYMHPSTDGSSVYDRLDKLKKLYEKELITKEEYDKERQELLDEL